jgi:hypothetical protein
MNMNTNEGPKFYYECRELLLLWRFGEHEFSRSLPVVFLNEFQMRVVASQRILWISSSLYNPTKIQSNQVAGRFMDELSSQAEHNLKD